MDFGGNDENFTIFDIAAFCGGGGHFLSTSIEPLNSFDLLAVQGREISGRVCKTG